MNRRVRLACLAFWLTAGPFLLTACSQSDLDSNRVVSPGQELFDENCAPCHEQANPELKKQPPKLDGLFRSRTLPSGAPATDDQVRKTIVEGRGTMPAFDRRLTPDELEQLIHYLHALR